MITKIQPPHPYLAVTLRYNFRKVEKGEASVLYTRGLKFKNTEDVFFEITKQRFYDTLPEHYRTVNIVFHASINPHKDDNLDDQTIEYFIDDYMEKLGYGGQPYIVFKHEDIDRTHYHVVSLNVDSKGEKINDRFLKKRSWQILKELSKKYGIKPPNQHLKEEKAEKLATAPTPIIYSEGNLANRIKVVVDYVMDVYSPKSIGELSALLYGYNISLETTKDESKTNEEESGLVYSIIKENERVSVGIKASDLGYYYLRKQLDVQFKANKKQWKEYLSNRIKYAVIWSLRNAKDPIKFIDNLNDLGISVRLLVNDEGRIYGVTYIDLRRGIVCNGSYVGTEFSANALDDYFNQRVGHQWTLNKERAYCIEKAISRALHTDCSFEEFIKRLSDMSIDTMVERDENGEISNLIFADNKHHVLIGSNELSTHYSTLLLKNYFEEGGENFWINDVVDKPLWAETHAKDTSQRYSQSGRNELLDDIIDGLGGNTGDNNALAIGKMYQRQAERNWGRRRR